MALDCGLGGVDAGSVACQQAEMGDVLGGFLNIVLEPTGSFIVVLFAVGFVLALFILAKKAIYK